MEEGQLRLRQRVGNVPQLIGIDAHVVVSDESSDKLAVERIVRRIERTHTPVCIVVGIHAHTKRAYLTLIRNDNYINNKLQFQK